jgi:hypothetical protein
VIQKNIPFYHPEAAPVAEKSSFIRPYPPYSNVIYGHVHMAKTGGTSLNGILANRFERVCGHKGYSYNAYINNEIAKEKFNGSKPFSRLGGYGPDRVRPRDMNDIGYEDCDYISHEIQYSWWIKTFGDAKFFGTPMELHVPCRDPLDHLMSNCNFRNEHINCASGDDAFYKSVDKCVILKNRFNENLTKHFDVKCFDFKEQFTTYIDYMASKLQQRRFVSTPYVKRETNEQRNKTNECIWQHPDLMEKAKNYLLEKEPYYQFCDSCIGSEHDLLLASQNT